MKVNQARLNTTRTRRRLTTSLVATTLAAAAIPLAATSSSAALDPNVGPAAPHSIIVFPSRDFVHLDGYLSTDVLTMKVFRAGVEVGTTAPFSPDQADPKNPGTFMADVNHAGPPCWVGVTPDIRADDVIKVLTSPTTGDQTPTAGVTVTQPATKVNASTVTIKGTAVAAGGGQIPIDQLESRDIANKQMYVASGSRDIRAASVGPIAGKYEGHLAYDSATSTNWTATFTGLGGVNPTDGLSDADRAVQSESRGQWLGRNPLAVNENTIFEYPGGLIFPGPAVGCFAPLAAGPTVRMTAASDTGVSSTDGITSNTLPTFSGTTSLAAATSVNLYVDGVLAGPAQVTGGAYTMPLTTPLSAGPHTITVGEVNPLAIPTETMGNASALVTIDTTAPTSFGRTPFGNETNVAQARNITTNFRERVVSVGGSTFNLKVGTLPVSAAVTYDAVTNVATINPTAALAAGTKYTVTMTSGIKDLAGNPNAASTWNFTTGPAPTVTKQVPAVNAVAVSRFVNVTASFSEDVGLFSGTTFRLNKASTGVAVTSAVTYNATTHVATLNPSATLAANTKYTAVLSNALKDADGNRIPATSWSFTTGP
jgi:hypothetical protein